MSGVPPLSSSPTSPVLGPLSSPVPAAVSTSPSLLAPVFIASDATPGSTPYQAVEKALRESKVDPDKLKSLKVKGQFEQQDKSFGQGETSNIIADEHLTPDGTSYFQFTVQWEIAATDKTGKLVKVLVKQKIFTSVMIPKDSKEFQEAKQRAFKLAKSFELLQRYAISTPKKHLDETQVKVIQSKATLTFAIAKDAATSKETISLTFDKDVKPLTFLDETTKKVIMTATGPLTRLAKMNQTPVIMRLVPRLAPTSSPPPRPAKPAPAARPGVPEEDEFFDTPDWAAPLAPAPADAPGAPLTSPSLISTSPTVFSTGTALPSSPEPSPASSSSVETPSPSVSEIERLAALNATYVAHAEEYLRRLREYLNRAARLSKVQKDLDDLEVFVATEPLGKIYETPLLEQKEKLETELASLGSLPHSFNLSGVRRQYQSWLRAEEALREQEKALEAAESGAGVFTPEDRQPALAQAQAEAKKLEEEIYKDPFVKEANRLRGELQEALTNINDDKSKQGLEAEKVELMELLVAILHGY